MALPHGTLPAQGIAALVEAGIIRSRETIAPAQIQPASLDLTLSAQAWSMPGSVLPRPGERVEDLLGRYARRTLDLGRPEVIVRGEVLVVRLREHVRLPPELAAYANGKSSIGRVDIQTRVLTDGNPRYDRLAAGYEGDLFLEIIPKSFDLRLRAGDSLNQVIFYRHRKILDGPALESVHARTPVLFDKAGQLIHGLDPLDGWASGGLLMTLDLDQPIVGWVAKKSYRPLDLARVGAHEPRDFFDPIHRPKDEALFLSREAFYIFSTVERVAVPPELAVEMLPYDTSAGEFRAHYAGFFDPGFGYRAGGTPAVLEVRPYEDDLIVRHEQPVCKMAFEALTEPPDRLYGYPGSHYADQRGPRLSKFFREYKC